MSGLKRYYVVLSVATLVLISACSSNTVRPDDPNFAPVSQERLIPAPAQGGSLFQKDFGISLFDDHKAFRVGDIITVSLDENTESSKSADTSVKKDTDISLANPTLFGRTASGRYGLGIGVESENDFSGSSLSGQSNSLVGNITVTIVDVLPNGVLKIRGEKWITLNQGEEYIRISGMVRTEDISANNQVSSMRIANSRISYGGVGTLADSNRQGVLSQFFNSRWWPF
ncbi:MAG: flagellar basal body L-ring protein FlgH [Pseudomonadales bacterium]|jgi:flagellar L-ring protein precursor FlgH|nr:flagellar basal body L-ring protein FlgH [Pseudomonadales bacterium]